MNKMNPHSDVSLDSDDLKDAMAAVMITLCTYFQEAEVPLLVVENVMLTLLMQFATAGGPQIIEDYICNFEKMIDALKEKLPSSKTTLNSAFILRFETYQKRDDLSKMIYTVKTFINGKEHAAIAPDGPTRPLKGQLAVLRSLIKEIADKIEEEPIKEKTCTP